MTKFPFIMVTIFIIHDMMVTILLFLPVGDNSVHVSANKKNSVHVVWLKTLHCYIKFYHEHISVIFIFTFKFILFFFSWRTWLSLIILYSPRDPPPLYHHSVIWHMLCEPSLFPNNIKTLFMISSSFFLSLFLSSSIFIRFFDWIGIS